MTTISLSPTMEAAARMTCSSSVRRMLGAPLLEERVAFGGGEDAGEGRALAQGGSPLRVLDRHRERGFQAGGHEPRPLLEVWLRPRRVSGIAPARERPPRLLEQRRVAVDLRDHQAMHRPAPSVDLLVSVHGGSPPYVPHPSADAVGGRP